MQSILVRGGQQTRKTRVIGRSRVRMKTSKDRAPGRTHEGRVAATGEPVLNNPPLICHAIRRDDRIFHQVLR